MVEWRNIMAKWRNGRMAGMAEWWTEWRNGGRMAEWSNGGNSYLPTILWYTPMMTTPLNHSIEQHFFLEPSVDEDR